MFSDLEEDQDKRMEAHARRLGTCEFICLTCGNPMHPAALENSHIAPKRFHEDAGPQCRNCHAEFSDKERHLAYRPQTGNPRIEMIGRYLVALAEWLKRVAETIAAFGAWLLGLADSLPEGSEAVAK